MREKKRRKMEDKGRERKANTVSNYEHTVSVCHVLRCVQVTKNTELKLAGPAFKAACYRRFVPQTFAHVMTSKDDPGDQTQA
jgi:hypothetical protein